jgi:hypothetical protein
VALLAGLVAVTVGAAEVRPPVPDAARVSLTFANGKSFVLGDIIEATFTLSNAGPNSFIYETGGDYRGTGFPTRYQFTVRDETGTALPAETWMNMGGLGGPRELKPGQKHDKLLRLQNYVRVTRPGVFTVRVVHDFGWNGTNEKPLPVAEAIITVTLPTPEQASKRVHAIAAVDDGPKENELGAYWQKTEFRYLNHPVFLPALEESAAGGEVNAMEGLQRIESKDATRALMRLLEGEDTNIVHAAVLFLSRRMPLRTAGGHPRTPGWFATPEEAAANASLWVPEAARPLRASAGKLLHSGNVRYMSTGAFVIESIGTSDDADAVLHALGATLKDWKIRSNPEDNVLNAPGAGDAILSALEGLRERGYRAPKAGGIEVIMASLLELGDPGIPRRDGWEQLLEAFFAQNPPMLREAAVRALPKPPTGTWEKLLREALDDRDRGVMRQACVAAGESKNPVFADPLANIVRTERHEWVVRSASEALTRIGAHWAATDAWIERLADEKLYYQGLEFLVGKLEHPKSCGSGGRTDLPREGRVTMREKWQQFFSDQERRAQVRSGKLVLVSEDQARDLLGGVYHLTIDGGGTWPGEKK